MIVDRPEPQSEFITAQKLSQSAHFRLLGFCVRIETNSAGILAAASRIWLDAPAMRQQVVTLRLRVVPGPPFHQVVPTVRITKHILCINIDSENFIICDLEQGSAFGWVTDSLLANQDYFQYHVLEAAAKCLLSTTRVTALHAACVSFRGTGFLFCGQSGAGKTTLAYACAQAGWTFTSDDASYLLWDDCVPKVRGNCGQVRFRPPATEIFSNLGNRPVTNRSQGKPSLEIPTHELGIEAAEEARIDHIIFLDRTNMIGVELTAMKTELLRSYFKQSLFGSEAVRAKQSTALRSLEEAQIHRMAYRDLDIAIHCLEELATRSSHTVNTDNLVTSS